MHWLRQAARIGVTILLWLGFAGTALAFENELNGTWVGPHCSGGQTTFRFSTRDQAHVWAGEHWCSPQTCGDVDYRFSDFQREARTFSIRAVRGSSFQSFNFSIDFTLSADGQTLTGIYNGHPMCGEVVLHRQSAAIVGGPYDRTTPAPMPNTEASFAAEEADRASEARENAIGAEQERAAREAAERAEAERRRAASQRGSGGGAPPIPQDALMRLPADLRPPQARPGPPRDVFLPADPGRSRYYAQCVAGFRALEEVVSARGRPALLFGASATAQQLQDWSNNFMIAAAMVATDPQNSGNYLSDDVILANQRSLVMRLPYANGLEEFVGICLLSGGEEAAEAVARLAAATR